ncbi:acyl-CoA dehydrogenase [Rhodococcus sp. OK519]|uniref:acyl-CoA dehydrogenase family protein n=1 Tax=Rhodococcus sp. OK519 TaxID=2135729 RepID=UPI000D405A77|nr:acyl-CoA dehydrogenase [Rhodococcus sp. OK519]
MREHHAELGNAVRAVLGTRRRTDSRPVDDVDGPLWKDLEELGFTSLTVPLELGGSGGDLLDAAVIVRESVTAAAPLAETLFLVGPLLTAAGLSLPQGPITAAAAENVELGRDGDGWHLSGVLRGVPWISGADHAVLLVRRDGRDSVALVSTGEAGFTVVQGRNLAGEPRGTALLDRVRVAAIEDLGGADWFRRFELLGATARAVQMAGAAGAVLAATREYVHVRNQFGRPLVAFQAVQHQLARLAADVVTVEVASEAAVLALVDEDPQAELLVSAAKAEASSLAGPIASAAHQAHGAIGFTMEHSLGAFTTRLWAWRDEYGNELRWWSRIADLVHGFDGDLWGLVTGTAPIRPGDGQIDWRVDSGEQG